LLVSLNSIGAEAIFSAHGKNSALYAALWCRRGGLRHGFRNAQSLSIEAYRELIVSLLFLGSDAQQIGFVTFTRGASEESA
jgi:hypothetical protein